MVEVLEFDEELSVVVHLIPNHLGHGELRASLVEAVVAPAVGGVAVRTRDARGISTSLHIPVEPVDQACFDSCNAVMTGMGLVIGIVCGGGGGGLVCVGVSAAAGHAGSVYCNAGCALSTGNFFGLGAQCPDGLYCEVHGSVATMRQPTATVDSNADIALPGWGAYVLAAWIRPDGTKIFTDFTFAGTPLNFHDVNGKVAAHNFRFNGIVHDNDAAVSRIRCTVMVEIFSSVPLLRNDSSITTTIAYFTTSKPTWTIALPAPPCNN